LAAEVERERIGGTGARETGSLTGVGELVAETLNAGDVGTGTGEKISTGSRAAVDDARTGGARLPEVGSEPEPRKTIFGEAGGVKEKAGEDDRLQTRM
jgi:hypothetical protein